MRPGRLAFLAVALLVVAPSAGHAQALQIQSLRFPTTSVVGPWVTYRVRTQSRALTPRDYTQRVAIVGREKYRGKDGFWVELKTDGLPSGKRIERGFFTIVDTREDYKNRKEEMADLPPDSFPVPRPPTVRLVRYQVLTSGGKLYEYPVGGGAEVRAGSDVGRIGRRIVPTVVERTRRIGSDSWADPTDSAYVIHPILTQKYWRNAAVPITGFARSLFQVTMERAPAPARDSAAASASAPGDIAARRAPPGWLGRSSADSSGADAAPVITKTELELIDLGSDAVPEVTQTPEESAPPGSEPPGPIR